MFGGCISYAYAYGMHSLFLSTWGIFFFFILLFALLGQFIAHSNLIINFFLLNIYVIDNLKCEHKPCTLNI